jgi:hypothetical protein
MWDGRKSLLISGGRKRNEGLRKKKIGNEG